MTGSTRMAGFSKIALGDVKIATAGKACSQTPKMRMRKMPVTNSGVAVSARPATEIVRSTNFPSLIPAIMPKMSARGMTMRNASPASTSVLRTRGHNVTETGRPVCNDFPASKRTRPLRNGMY
ncbi:MAG: hypothetical protein R2851_07720 [Caldilineaceae bacterium]